MKPNIYENPVILVCSPFQVMCAAEAVINNVGSACRLVVLETECQNNNRQVIDVVSFYAKCWTTTNYIKMRKISKVSTFLFAIKLKMLLVQLKQADIVYVGDPRVKAFQLISCALKHKKVIFLDDGLAALGYVSFFNKSIVPPNFHLSISKGIKLFFKIKTSKYLNVSFRSIFDINSEDESFKIEITKCNLSSFVLNDGDKALEIERNNYFIGQKLVEMELVDLEYYISLVDRYARELKIKNQSLIYISHRGESPSTISRLKLIDNVEVLSLSLPVELYFTSERMIPLSVCSFYSTALITLSMIFSSDNTEFSCINISNKVNSSNCFLPTINAAYEQISSYNILIKNND